MFDDAYFHGSWSLSLRRSVDFQKLSPAFSSPSPRKKKHMPVFQPKKTKHNHNTLFFVFFCHPPLKKQKLSPFCLGPRFRTPPDALVGDHGAHDALGPSGGPVVWGGDVRGAEEEKTWKKL